MIHFFSVLMQRVKQTLLFLDVAFLFFNLSHKYSNTSAARRVAIIEITVAIIRCK